MTSSPSVGEAAAEVTQVVIFVTPPESVSVLRAVLNKLPSHLPAAAIFLVHTGTGAERPLAPNLNVSPRLLVLPGIDGTRLRNGRGYVVSEDHQLMLDGNGSFCHPIGTEAIVDGFLLSRSKLLPTVDIRTADHMLASLAAFYGKGAVAVALTALSPNESEGFRRVRCEGGHTIALNEANRLWADSSGPRVVASAGDEYLLDAEIGPRLASLLAPASG